MADYSVTENPIVLNRGASSLMRAEFELIQTAIATKIDNTGDTYTGTHNMTGATVTVAAPTTGSNPVTKTYADALSMAAGNMPVGGTTGQYLKKSSATNYDASWDGITKTIEVLTSGTSWVCPAGVTSVKATLIGGGGGGSRYGTNPPGHGGGGGACAIKMFTSTPGASYTYAIGAAGAAAGSDGTAGSAGGNTTLNTGVVTVTAGGGSGGAATPGYHTIGGVATNGDLNIKGGYGWSISGGGNSFGGDSMLGTGSIGSTAETFTKSGYGGGGNGVVDGNSGVAGGAGVIVLEY